MGLTDYISDVGRPVAYYPKLKSVTGSTTATIFLCQLLYWSDKTDDGWIWKTSDEMEEETGLTYNEQKTAKEKLEELNLIEYEFKRLDHTSRYKVNQDELNRLWELLSGLKMKTIEKKKAKEVAPKPEATQPKRVEKKGDWLDCLIDTANTPELQKMEKMNEMRGLVEKKLNINTKNKKWDMFIEYAYNRQTKDSQPLSRFIEWALSNGFNPIYWTAEKMTTIWPQAFISATSMKPRDDFVEKLPEYVEKEVAPMPRHLGKKNTF